MLIRAFLGEYLMFIFGPKSSLNMAADFERFSVKKPLEDLREYAGLKLQNQLKLLLISDPETDISAASLSVHCGSLLDPVSLQGLAHYLEHMCFMGSEKVREFCICL